tara:strand:- start:3110 stop:3754 length:645 start_codon:yes stop_codon:yes gene_type:complete
MKDLVKRSFTSIPLIFIFYLSLLNQLIFFFLLIIISFFVLDEIFSLIKNIFIKDKSKILIFYLITIIYLLFFFTQLYLFVNFNYVNKLYFVFFLAICIATDIGGYIFGNLFKGKKLTKISPNKTYSGLIGSYFLSLLVFSFFYYQFKFSYSLLILTFFISSISQIGDLFISYLKRKAKVKNTGDLLPGHGGILDRIDGIIFGIPFGINLLFVFK